MPSVDSPEWPGKKRGPARSTTGEEDDDDEAGIGESDGSDGKFFARLDDEDDWEEDSPDWLMFVQKKI